MKEKIIGIGEALWDCLPEGKKLGGAPANFAYHASQYGFDSVAISALGNDPLAEETITSLKQHGLKYLMPQVSFPTGTVEVELDQQGIPTYDIKENVAWDNIPYTDEMKQLAHNCMAVCWGSLAQRNNISRTTINKFINDTPDNCLKIFDINLRQNFFNKEIIEDSMKKCNILKINDEELIVVKKMLGLEGIDEAEMAKELIGRYNIEIIVLTCGTNGSFVFTANDKSFENTPRVEVADTVGAGDSFTAAFCSALLKGKSFKDAHKIAVRVSAYVCTQNGAMPILPEEYLV